MKKWTSRLTTFIGVLLILLAIYLFAKPHIDNYLHEKITTIRLRNMTTMKKGYLDETKDTYNSKG